MRDASSESTFLLIRSGTSPAVPNNPFTYARHPSTPSIDDIESNPAYINSGLSVYTIAISISSAELKKYKTHSEIIEALKTLSYVYHIEEMRG